MGHKSTTKLTVGIPYFPQNYVTTVFLYNRKLPIISVNICFELYLESIEFSVKYLKSNENETELSKELIISKFFENRNSSNKNFKIKIGASLTCNNQVSTLSILLKLKIE